MRIKFPLLMLTMLLSGTTFALTAEDCEKNAYKPSLSETVVAIDWADKFALNQTFSLINQVFVQNRLQDTSCFQVAINADKKLFCINDSGIKQEVGQLSAKVARAGEYDFYMIDWNQNVKIKSAVKSNSCAYGLEVK